MSLLQLHNFSVSFQQNKVVKDLNLDIREHQITALIGESGSGKSVTAQSICRLIDAADISGSCLFDNVDLVSCSKESMRKIRQRDIAYIFQEPMTALNPLIRCGDQITECMPKEEDKDQRLEEVLQQVELADWQRMAKSYPHELSGGQRQRIMIAMALAKRPRLLIADEPTTALDVAVQTEILDLLKELCTTAGLTVLFITHDLLSLKNFADFIAVMYQGSIVEQDEAVKVLTHASHPYTKALIQSRANYDKKGFVLAEVEDLLASDSFTPESLSKTKVSDEVALEVEGLHKSHIKKGIFRKEETKVLHGIDFTLNKGDCLGLIGESGSGKSTVAKIILSIWPASQGRVILDGQPLKNIDHLDKEVQLVFQDPFSSLNPKHRIGDAIAEAAPFGSKKSKQIAKDILEEVGLSASDYSKYPHEFSGGQRQRICIAKALVKEPQLLVLDEAVSALDVSVQAKILNLLNKLKAQRNLTYLLISHDLNVVSYFCNKIVVLREGKIVEQGLTENLIHQPVSKYTKQLLEHSVH